MAVIKLKIFKKFKAERFKRYLKNNILNLALMV